MADKITEVYYVCLEDDKTTFLPGINPDGPGYHALNRVLADSVAWQKSLETGQRWKTIAFPSSAPPPQSISLPIPLIIELETRIDAAWPFPHLLSIDHHDYKPPRSLDAIKHITIHHSAGSRATTNVTYWHRLHTQTKSWSRCGYHLAIGSLTAGDPIELYEVNLPEWVTWHDSRNYDTYAVTMAGDLRAGHDVEPDEAQLDCFGRAMAYALPLFPRLESIVPHRLWQATACPGDIDRWYPLLVGAAKAYGQDIEPLLRFRATRRARLVRAFGKRFQGGPPPSSYLDV